MAEKRKPVAVFLLRIQGKKGLRRRARKVELFDSKDWPLGFFKSVSARQGFRTSQLYRLRVDGKWWNDREGGPTLVDIWRFRDLYFQQVAEQLRRGRK